jgi:hypothetical protein
VTFKEKVQTAQAMVTMAAVIVGGFWTYHLFVKERHQYPHAKIEQKVSHVALSKKTNLLRVGVDITNTGTSRIVIAKGIARIQQILPLSECPDTGACATEEIKVALANVERKADGLTWPLLAARNASFTDPLDIEPGEKDSFEFEFVIPSNVEVVRIYTYFRNDKKSTATDEIGWWASSYYSFSKPDRSAK